MRNSPAAKVIRLWTLSDARIETPRASIGPSAEIVFATALYLVLERANPIARRTLAELLWPQATTASAAHRLRQTLLKLRRLGLSVTDLGNGCLGLGSSIVESDMERLPDLCLDNTSGLDRLMGFLPGYRPSFSSAYQDWLDSKRSAAEADLTRVILDFITERRVCGDWQGIEKAATALLKVSPFNEEGTLALAEAYAMRGAKLEATRILDRYLEEVGSASTELRLPATIMRKRIVQQLKPRSRVVALEAPLLGRSSAMSVLTDLLNSAIAGVGEAAVVIGSAGIGKSRLLDELASFATLQGVAVQKVQCRPSDPHRPLSVFVDLVPSLRGMRGAIGCSPETMAYLDRLTTTRQLESRPDITNGDPSFVYARVERALFDLVDAVSEEQPLMILIDDTHWADDISLNVLGHMIDRCRANSILFALAGRERPRSLATISPLLTELELAPLEARNAEELIRTIVRQQGQEMEEDYLKWCVGVAEGNPFFLEELSKQWLESGAQHKAPSSLNSVLTQRIARLRPDSLQLLQTCSALEDHSTFDRIEAVLQYAPHRLLRAVDDLGSSGMLLARSSDEQQQSSNSIEPIHELMARAVLHRLAPAAKAFLHRRIATVLENEVMDETSTAILWDCAKHWQLAGDSFRAFQLAKSCGRHLMDVGLPAAAADAFERALSFCSNRMDAIDILTAQIKAYEQSSSWSAVVRTEKLARSLLQQSFPDQSGHDDLELASLRANWRTETRNAPIDRLLHCLRDEQASTEHRVKAGAMALMVQDSDCRYDDMPSAFEQVQSIRTETDQGRIAYLEAEMVYHTVCGSLERAIEATESLLAIKRTKKDDGDLFRHLCNASIPYRTAGRFENAASCLREAAAIAEAHNLPRSLGRALPMLAHLALERGDMDEARSIHQQIARHATESDDINDSLDAGAIALRIALADGDLARAQAVVRKRSDQIALSKKGSRRTYALALSVAVHLAADEPVDASMLTVFEGAYLQSRRSVAQAFSTYVLYFTLSRCGRETRARQILDEYHQVYRREPWQASNLFQQLAAQFGVTRGSPM
jgi:tetratricopeptide (TPR) repeat protein